MSISSEISRLQNAKADLKTALENKGVTVPSSATLDDYADLVDGIILEEKDVAFYDYDGTLLYTYDADEFAELTALPALVNHYPDLEAVEWNWTLAEAKEYVAKYGGLSIGQICNPVDCATRMVLTVDSGEEVSFGYVSTETYSAITIDWGDGSPQETSGVTNTHVYSAAGKYVIKIMTTKTTLHPIYFDKFANVEEINYGSQVTYFGSNYSPCRNIQRISMSGNDRWNINAFSKSMYLQALVFPRSATSISIGNGTFDSVKAFSMPPTAVNAGVPNLPNVKMITAPETESINTGGSNSGALGSCKILVLPNYQLSSLSRYTYLPALRKLCLGTSTITAGTNFQNIGTLEELDLSDVTVNNISNLFTSMRSLKKLTLPSNVTVIGSNNYTAVYNLEEVTIPASVTTINNNCFTNANKLGAVHLKPTSPPELKGTSVFTERQSPCVFYVPYSEDHSILEAYQTATNWSTFASYMQEELE